MTQLKKLGRSLRQLDISIALGVNQNTIAGIERGQLCVPKNLIEPLCNYFGVQREDVFSENRMAL